MFVLSFFTSSPCKTCDSGGSGKFGEWFINQFQDKDVYFRANPEGERNVAQDNIIYYNINQRVNVKTTAGAQLSPFYVTIAHEMGHLYGNVKGTKNNDKWYDIEVASKNDPESSETRLVKKDEIIAISVENMIRASNNIPPRIYYSSADGIINSSSYVLGSNAIDIYMNNPIQKLYNDEKIREMLYKLRMSTKSVLKKD